jgi:hypothetical protein
MSRGTRYSPGWTANTREKYRKYRGSTSANKYLPGEEHKRRHWSKATPLCMAK